MGRNGGAEYGDDESNIESSDETANRRPAREPAIESWQTPEYYPELGKSDEWNSLEDSEKEKIIERLEKDFQFSSVLENWDDIKSDIESGNYPENWGFILDAFLLDENLGALQDLLVYIPEFQELLNGYIQVKKEYQDLRDDATRRYNDFLARMDTSGDELMTAFFGRGFEPAEKYFNTHKQLQREYAKLGQWADIPPESIFPWEMRIGLTRLVVPPLNINVTTTNRVTSLGGGAIRQGTSPKFNAGHSDTTIEMTLYFPTHEAIWGLGDFKDGRFDINFDDPTHAEAIDKIASSLRGLIAQFKYAPFVPIKNAYLNQTYDITAVAMHSMSIATVENFPFCLGVTLTLLKFNHEVYLPMVGDFNSAVHWGRYRHYIGQAMRRMEATISEGFLTTKEVDKPTEGLSGPAWVAAKLTSEEETSYDPIDPTLTSPYADYRHNWGNQEWRDGRALELYYPTKTPNKIFAPDTSMFRQPGEDLPEPERRSAWNSFLERLGIDIDSNTDATYDAVTNYSAEISAAPNEREVLLEYLRIQGMYAQADAMTPEAREAFIDEVKSNFITAYKAEHGGQGPSQEALQAVEDRYSSMWFGHMFTSYKDTDWYRSYVQAARFREGKFWLEEWEIPMEKISLNPKNVIINGVSVGLANNIARLQVQMQEEPALQHLGGRDSTIDISLTVIGEADLINLRRMFRHVQSLARLEAGHGVLGFLGIKNYITALAGIKYFIPLSLEHRTVPGYPHTYEVDLSFVDFDILQQRREELSSDQQQELVDAFGKRNPFLRIRQLWGSFNGYPDMPLTVRNSDAEVIGTFAPDYYFKAFQTVDDEIVKWGIDNRKTGNAAGTAKEIAVAQALVKGEIKEPKGPDHLTGYRDNYTNYVEVDTPPTEGEAVEGTDSRQPTGYEIAYDDTEVQRTTLRTYVGTMGEEQDTAYFIENSAGSFKLGESHIGEFDPRYASAQAGASDEGGLASEFYFLEDSASVIQTQPNVPGTKPVAAYQAPLADGTDNPAKQWELMMQDAQYRDINGRMVRAFPTYMLWLIDEGGRFAGVKLFDNFYGLQSVLDFSVVRSEDIMADTLVLRLSNLYNKLGQDLDDYLNYDNPDDILNTTDTSTQGDRERNLRLRNETMERNLQSGLNDQYMVHLQNIRLRPGVRLHLRAGYSPNPNALETIFNGTITDVQQGDVVTVTAQSDAVELSHYVNTTDKQGHSGQIDGSISTGFHLSEPRDLMVQLLSMGASTFRQAFAAATDGLVFSENRFGIRHFGHILYEPLTAGEQEKQERRYQSVQGVMHSITNSDDVSSASLNAAGGIANLSYDDTKGGLFGSLLGNNLQVRSPALDAMNAMAINFMRKRDFELFKRNIYPGNGTGIAQYLGGDIADVGEMMQVAQKNAAGEIINDATQYPEFYKEAQQVHDMANDSGVKVPINEAATAALGQDLDGQPTEQDIRDESTAETLDESEAIDRGRQNAPFAIVGGAPVVLPGGIPLPNPEVIKAFFGQGELKNSPLYSMLGITSLTEDDLTGFDEVSFRAQTYMKTIWDLFKVCAALLPNYIVAVRPFEGRSTIFYGKPHWLYTSGVIPITTGIPPDNAFDYEKLDEESNKLLRDISDEINPLSDAKAQVEFLQGLSVKRFEGGGDPNQTTQGIQFTGDISQVLGLPNEASNGARLPLRTGKFALEQHLPTTEDYVGGVPKPKSQWDASKHKQLPDLPADQKFPAYEGINGSHGAGSFGPLSPEEEQWYVVMRWPYSSGYGQQKIDGQTQDMFRGRRILVFHHKSGKAVVGTPGDWGPGVPDRAGGLSPDIMHYFGADPVNDEFSVGWVPDNTALGPAGDLAGSTTAQPLSEGASGPPTLTHQPEGVLAPESQGEDGGVSPDANPAGDIPFLSGLIPNFNRAVDAGALRQLENMGWYDESNRSAYDPAKYNGPNDFAYKFGWDEFDNHLVEAYYGIEALEENGVYVDETGTVARRIYDKEFNAEVRDFKIAQGMDQAQAEAEWKSFNDAFTHDTFAKNFRSKDEAIAIWYQVRKKFANEEESNFAYKAFQEIQSNSPNDEDLPGYGESVYANSQQEDEDGPSQFRLAMSQFLAFMWQSPAARAWVVLTTDKRMDKTDVIELDSIIPGSAGDNVEIGILDGLAGPLAPLTIGGRELFQSITGDEGDKGYDLTRSPITDAWLYYILPESAGGLPKKDLLVAGSGSATETAMLDWLEANDEPGNDAENLLEGAVEGLARGWDQTIGKLLTAAAQSLQGLVAVFRLSMQQLGHGLDLAGSAQRRANVLNKVLNDSIYYAAGPGLIPKLVDNPFTREFGEPVVEIREPFQRMHFKNSFQHIIGNQVVETTNDVATVITASSDGKYPVTVHFDKGAPSERQVERAVETGIVWDNARGEGFFSFLHPLLHPVETLRGLAKMATGSNDELLSKRIALWHLKESLKDIYQGEIVVLGDPSIRPYDLVYLADVYERMYGMFEVEQVVHHFTADEGFYTSITPNAIVTINDPARWSMISYAQAMWSQHHLKNATRNLLHLKADGSTSLDYGVSRETLSQELGKALSTDLKGSLQFTHGNAALVRDVTSYYATGMMPPTSGVVGPQTGLDAGTIGAAAVGGAALFGAAANPITMAPTLMLGNFAWGAWEWVRDNLLDQHGCYIQYMNRDGQPMDAGLSYNQGVAVGKQHSINLLPGVIGLPTEVDVKVDGHSRITTDDLLAQLGWSEISIDNLERQVSWWVDNTNKQILDAAGAGPDPVDLKNIEVAYETLVEVIDGDTILAESGHRYRLTPLNTPEIGRYGDSDIENPENDPGQLAKEFVEATLASEMEGVGHPRTFAVRINKLNDVDSYGRRLGVIFHRTPVGTDPAVREQLLREYAGSGSRSSSQVFIPWDSYMSDSRPFTLNWELITSGHAGVYMDGVQMNNPDRDL